MLNLECKTRGGRPHCKQGAAHPPPGVSLGRQRSDSRAAKTTKTKNIPSTINSITV